MAIEYKEKNWKIKMFENGDQKTTEIDKTE